MWTGLGAALVVGVAPFLVDALGGLAGTELERRTADATSSWYGPAGLLAVIGATAIGAARLRSRKGSLREVLLAAAPLILLVLLALTLTYDPFRGRFLMSGIALSAATWGVLLARRWLGLGTAALAIVTVFLSLQTFDAKPSGLPLGNYMRPAPWGQPRWSVQTILRPDGNERAILRFFEHHVPTDARVALALNQNDLISPYFGPHATRNVSLVPEGYAAPARAEWFVIAPVRKVDLCRVDWRQRFALRSGWIVLRRVGTDGCQT